MSRKLRAAVAQFDAIHLPDSRAAGVKRLGAALRKAHGNGTRFVVFPELTLTTFFPRWWMTDHGENAGQMDAPIGDIRYVTARHCSSR